MRPHRPLTACGASRASARRPALVDRDSDFADQASHRRRFRTDAPHITQLLRDRRATSRSGRPQRRRGARAVQEFDPQVITLDVNMPEMDGLTCLCQIMMQAPRPVVMVSSLTEKGAEATLCRRLSSARSTSSHKPGGTMSLDDRPHRSDCWSEGPRRRDGDGCGAAWACAARLAAERAPTRAARRREPGPARAARSRPASS